MIRLGLVGGGPGSFIGAVHRMAAELDGRIALVAGAFSSDPERSRTAGRGYGIDETRAYPSLEAMIAAEAARDDGIQMIAIATPNHLHSAAARAALEAGLGVVCDKPAAVSLTEAEEIAETVRRRKGLYALTYTYTGYPMIREARSCVQDGVLGVIRKIVVEYYQGWLADPIEHGGSKQASWRTDPARAGVGGCIGDIGVHAFNLVEFVSGLRVRSLLADLKAVVPGRALDDDCTVLLRLDGGARGLLAASQIATGERNNLVLRIYGEHAALRWSHEEADRLRILQKDGTERILWTGTGAIGSAGVASTRLPSGHPEGFIEAFANLYRDFADRLEGREASLSQGISEGVRSMAFIETAVAASTANAGWVPLIVPGDA